MPAHDDIGEEHAPDDWLLEGALDALDDVFYLFDPTGRLVRWNERLNELFDLTDEELSEMTPEKFFLPEDGRAVEAAFEEALVDGETKVEARAETTEGRVLFELTGRSVNAPDGRVAGVAGVGRDITTQRHNERKLGRQNDRLETFASVVSHDLRNPLSVAMGYLELERGTNDSEYLGRAAAALERVDDIIDDVLAAAREGEVVERTAPVELRRVAEAAWASVETVDATLSVETDASVDADEARLRRIFENLFRNASHHVASDVAVRVGELADGFYVEDDGQGVPESDRKRVFDPGVTSTARGTGIGLNIVRSLAEAQGWAVSLTSGTDGGARFEFTSADNRRGRREGR
ncbi:PAS domain-containing sensor histidine kinase [Halopelagius inordinatus]|nr:PAS domain-containing sensor histidine kinase [Halopelagius inordinatus]